MIDLHALAQILDHLNARLKTVEALSIKIAQQLTTTDDQDSRLLILEATMELAQEQVGELISDLIPSDDRTGDLFRESVTPGADDDT